MRRKSVTTKKEKRINRMRNPKNEQLRWTMNNAVGRITAASLLLWAFAVPTLHALDDSEIPADAPPDSVMATAEEIREMLDWANASFFGPTPAGSAPAVRVEVRRQVVIEEHADDDSKEPTDLWHHRTWAQSTSALP